MEYSNKTYILRDGDLEHYLNINKDLAEVVAFCANRLPQFLQEDSNHEECRS
jgi:hypothetical protein